MSVDELGTIFASENMEVATVKLSKLDTGKAVNIFGSLPDDHVLKNQPYNLDWQKSEI